MPPAYPLQTDGNRIVDANGERVVIQGVNWFGFETANQAPHGLWVRDYRDMLEQISELDFNAIRLPFSLEMLTGDTTSGIVYAGDRNTELLGKTPLEVMDIVIDEAEHEGLMVILDNHSQANDGYTHDLWFGQDGYTEDDWVAAWQMLAERYANQPNVIGFDLKNEPHGVATWGDGSPTDWRRAAERAGNAVLAIAPDKLIIVEGIEGPVEGGQIRKTHWWGGNLEGVRNNPVRLAVPNRLVYSPHEYGPEVFDHYWFSDPQMAKILAERWEDGFGYIHDRGIAPIMVGEFGAINVSPTTTSGRWIRQFTEYLADKAMGWTYWAWNPNSGDTGGVLTDDWTTVHDDKMALLTKLMTNVAPERPITLTARAVSVASWKGGSCYVLKVRNTSTDLAPAWQAQLRLPKGAKVTSTWNGTAQIKGRKVTVSPPSWGQSVAEGETNSHFGFCMKGAGKPSKVTAFVP